MNKSLPIFPLGIVVLPGNIQSLQIFELRYLKMIKDVMRGDNQFVISLLSNSNQDISFKDKGTLVEIIDFNDLPNGLLGITVKGATRVVVERLLRKQKVAGSIPVVGFFGVNPQLTWAKKGCSGDRTRDLPHPKRESYH